MQKPPTRILLIGAVVAVMVSLAIGGITWPAVNEAYLEPNAYQDSRYEVQKHWRVSFTTGDVMTVPRERDTLTSESVLKSRQVGLMLGRLERRHMVGMMALSSLIFLGVWASTRPSVRQRVKQFAQRDSRKIKGNIGYTALVLFVFSSLLLAHSGGTIKTEEDFAILVIVMLGSAVVFALTAKAYYHDVIGGAFSKRQIAAYAAAYVILALIFLATAPWSPWS